jgi:hypothetical protein
VLQVLFQVAALRNPLASWSARSVLAAFWLESNPIRLFCWLNWSLSASICCSIVRIDSVAVRCSSRKAPIVLLDHPVVFQQQLFFLSLRDGLLVLVNRIQNQGDFLGFEFIRQTQELPGGFCLLAQRFDPFRKLLDDIIDPDQVLLGLEQFALGFFFPGLEFDDAGRFFENPPPVFRPVTQDIIHPARPTIE